MHTPPFNLVVGPPGGTDPVALVDRLTGRAVPGVLGDPATAYGVARAWTDAHGGSWTLRMDETLYTLDAAPAVQPGPGAVREATPADRGWLTRWLDEFHLEATPHMPLPDRSGSGRGPLMGGDRMLLLWVTGAEELPVSVAGVTAPQSGVSRIGPVYTPAAFRGHGYAAAVTAAAAGRAFANRARRVMLYADKANPTSNGVYRRLGFRPFDEVVMISFG